MVVFYACFIPPFQVPDEPSHFARAYQLTHGEFFPTKQEVFNKLGRYTVGGTVDPGIFVAARYYLYLQDKSKVDYAPETANACVRYSDWH